jgi:hypothetical protein
MKDEERKTVESEPRGETTDDAFDPAAAPIQPKLTSTSRELLVRLGLYWCYDVIFPEIRRAKDYINNAITDLSQAEHAPLPSPLDGVLTELEKADEALRVAHNLLKSIILPDPGRNNQRERENTPGESSEATESS